MKKTQVLFLLILFTFGISTFGQVGINTESPNVNSSLDINSQNGTKGVMLPRITTVQENILNASLNVGDEGLAFYNTDTDCIITWNGTIFKKLCEQGNAVYIMNCATSSIQGVYRAGDVTTSAEYIKLSINVTQEGPYDISGSSGNGYYFSSTGYLTTGQQDLIIPAYGKPTNTGVNTIALKNNSTSENLCSFNTTVLSGSGEVEIIPAQCTTIPTVTLVLDNANSVPVTIPITVTLKGPVSISTDVQNGVSFSGTANFGATGTSTIVMHSGGIPEKVGDYVYQITGTNGTACSIRVKVIPNTIVPNTTFTSVTVNGTYIETIEMSASQSISATGIRYTATAGGAYGVGVRYVSGGTGDPGLTFQNQTGTLSGPQTLNMTFPATSGTIATNSGVYTYELFDIYSNLSLTPKFTITVQAKLGTFANPASRCTEMLIQYPSSPDGYYWVKDNASTPNKYKTYCDMTNGGWTLVKSVSEKTILVTEKTQGESLNSQTARNSVTTETGVFNEFRFSLNAATVNVVGGSNTWPKYVRISIKEQGHTTASRATKEQVENSTVSPVNDSWMKNNYWNITMLSPLNASIQDINGQAYYAYHTSEGKAFGFPFGKGSTANNVHTFNGANFAANPPGFWNQTNFFTGFYSGLGYVASNIPANNLTYTSSNGSSATFNKYDINDMFGLYVNSERQVNHHIGTCANSTDDYGGASFCNAGWANWRPHNFNNGEGRILQYWIK